MTTIGFFAILTVVAIVVGNLLQTVSEWAGRKAAKISGWDHQMPTRQELWVLRLENICAGAFKLWFFPAIYAIAKVIKPAKVATTPSSYWTTSPARSNSGRGENFARTGRR